MLDAVGNAISGLRAAATRVTVSAGNIANATSEGSRAKEATSRSLGSGGVIVDITERDPATVSLTQADGTRAEFPNVSYEEELLSQAQATNSYDANAQVIRTQQEMFDTLLDIQS